LADVPAALSAQGLAPAAGMPSYVDTCAVSTVVVGEVCSQTPVANSVAQPEALITYRVLQAQPNVLVPSIRGLTEAQAMKALAAVGLQGQPKTVHDSSTPGTVVNQTPDSGVPAKPKSVVSFSLADGKLLVPTVQGKTVDAALSALNTGELLNTGQTTATTTTKKLDGTVKDSVPAAGSWVVRTARITLTVYKYVKPTPTCTPSSPATTTPDPSSSSSTGPSGSSGSSGASSGSSGSSSSTSPSPPTTTPSTTPSTSPATPVCTS
jgi:eukaryotic-like serine/threonine-protein kinase